MKFFLCLRSLSFVLCIAFGVFCPTSLFADYNTRQKTMEDVACIVISLEGGGSIVRGDTKVRSTMERGDIVFVGDSANLSVGANLSLSFDEKGLDMMRFQGPCTINFTAPTQVEMSHGTAFAILDNRKTLRLFKIKTPGAIASARNAHFVVQIKQQGAEIQSHQSNVFVHGVNAVGDEKKPGVMVTEGQKTNVPKMGDIPMSPPQALSNRDVREMKSVESTTNDDSQWMKRQPTQWIVDKIEETESRDSQLLKESVSSDEDVSEKSRYLF